MDLTYAPLGSSRLAELSDEDLIRRVAALDPAAFEILWDRHSGLAFTLAIRMLGTRTRAEDVLQEAFFGLWRNAGRFDPDRGSPRTWLLGMVHHRGIDALRRHSAHDRRRAPADDTDHLPDARADVHAQAIRRDEAAQVRTALTDLPAAQRQSLELAYYGGWTQSQVAEALDLPLGTIKGRTRMGLHRLSESLAELAIT